MKTSNIGSNFDDFLNEDGIYEDVVDSAFNKFTANKELRVQYEAREKRLKDEAFLRDDAREEGWE